MFGLILASDMNKLYLVGLPAAGKTTTAQWLAHKMGWTFIDLDNQIVAKTGLSIANLFHSVGEEAFREIEAACLRETQILSHTVVGCGGGTAAFLGNMDWMKANGLTVFLNTSFDVLVQRIMLNTPSRPMFQGDASEEIVRKLTEIAEKRSIFYGAAKIIWNRSEPNDLLYSAVNHLIK